jgi:hypothetical protein
MIRGSSFRGFGRVASLLGVLAGLALVTAPAEGKPDPDAKTASAKKKDKDKDKKSKKKDKRGEAIERVAKNGDT